MRNVASFLYLCIIYIYTHEYATHIHIHVLSINSWHEGAALSQLLQFHRLTGSASSAVEALA